MVKLAKLKNIYELFFNVIIFCLFIQEIKINSLYNITATYIYLFLYKFKIKKTFFLILKFKWRGDISKIKIKNKNIFLVDETYNSNPLSLQTAIENYDNIESRNSKKYLVLGDMLELGKHSYKQHKLMSKIVNKTNINKVYVIGKYIKETFKGLKSDKKAKILKKLDIKKLINDNLNNNDYLMIKGSNSTGLNYLTSNLKQRSSHAV